jgi:hypothetical protein
VDEAFGVERVGAGEGVVADGGELLDLAVAIPGGPLISIVPRLGGRSTSITPASLPPGALVAGGLSVETSPDSARKASGALGCSSLAFFVLSSWSFILWFVISPCFSKI